MSSNVERNNKQILRNLKRFFTWIHSRNLIHKTFLSFVQNLKRLLTKPSGSVFSLRNRTVCSFFLRNLFRRCTKLKKVSWIRLRECIQVKNLFRFRRICLLFLSTFELIWKLFASTEPFLVGSEKILFFLQWGAYRIHWPPLFPNIWLPECHPMQLDPGQSRGIGFCRIIFKLIQSDDRVLSKTDERNPTGH